MGERAFRIEHTQHAGRCVIANSPLSKGTVLLQSRPPVLAVIMREYRREVCAQCYQYDRGRNLPFRDASTGKAFCNHQHQRAWETEAEADKASWAILEEYVRRKGGREIEMADADAPRPTIEAIEAAWTDIIELSDTLREARLSSDTQGGAMSKRHRRAIHEALESRTRIVDPDVLSLLLAGILLHSRSTPSAPSSNVVTTTAVPTASSDNSTNEPSPWSRLLTLAPTPTPYPNRQNLLAHTHAYLILLALLPLDLLPSVTPRTCRAVPTHEVHNSFGLRSLGDGGDEFLGYGVWPEASLFNHSCEPNVAKARGRRRRRQADGLENGDASGAREACGDARVEHGAGEGEDGDGRTWTFWTTRDVGEGQELAISYLGGEEATLAVSERRRRLMDTWGFECRCGKCMREAD